MKNESENYWAQAYRQLRLLVLHQQRLLNRNYHQHDHAAAAAA